MEEPNNTYLNKKRNNDTVQEVIYISDDSDEKKPTDSNQVISHQKFPMINHWKFSYVNPRKKHKENQIIESLNELITMFVHYINRIVELDFQKYIEKMNRYIDEKLRYFMIGINRPTIQYGFDDIYPCTFIINFFTVFKTRINLLSKDSQLHQVQLNHFYLFSNYFQDCSIEDFNFILEKNKSVISELKKELFLYMIIYPQMLVNSNLYECFKIHFDNYSYFDYFSISKKEIENYATSSLFITTVSQMFLLQNIFISFDSIQIRIKDILKYNSLYYAPFPKSIISFSLINESILINSKFKIKKSNNIIKAILIVIILEELAMILYKQLNHDLEHLSYIETPLYFFDCVNEYNSITSVEWIHKSLFADTNIFFESNSNFICDKENYTKFEMYSDFRDKLQKINQSYVETENRMILKETEKLYNKSQ